MEQEGSLSREQDDHPLPSKRAPPTINPEDSLAWYVIVTAPRSEEKAEKALQDLGFTTYVVRETYWTRRKVHNRFFKTERQKPLIPRYLFLGFAPDNNWYSLREVGSVSGVLSSDGMPRRVAAHEVKRLADLEREGWFDERRRTSLGYTADGPPYQAGDQVRIAGESPFAGLAGLVRTASARQKVDILVSIFGRLTPTIVPISAIERIEAATSRI
jgi:transcriptional antiterminator NusG